MSKIWLVLSVILLSSCSNSKLFRNPDIAVLEKGTEKQKLEKEIDLVGLNGDVYIYNYKIKDSPELYGVMNVLTFGLASYSSKFNFSKSEFNAFVVYDSSNKVLVSKTVQVK